MRRRERKNRVKVEDYKQGELAEEGGKTIT